MESKAFRRRVAYVYAWLIGIASLEVVLQGFLFSGFYGRGQTGYIDAHGIAGELTGYLVAVVLVPLTFTARFPSRWRMGWLTVALALSWNVQVHVLGYGIQEIGRWLAMVHIPLAFAILSLAAFLTVRAWQAVRSVGTGVTTVGTVARSESPS